MTDIDRFHSSRCTFCDGVSEWTRYEATHFPSGVGYRCECGGAQIPVEYLDRYANWYMNADETSQRTIP